MLGEFPRIKKRISDPAKLASRTYRITWNLLSIQIVAMTSKFPGRPTTPMAAWKPARTCEKTIQHIPCKSILMNRWCFCVQVAMREFLLTISIRYQAEFQVMRIKKYKFEEYYLIQYKILPTNIWRVVIKDVNQWMTQATSEKKNSECSR